ncbi:MAG TPA: ABC transporter ATP-binding protein [Candidatus Acidoferrales bacterium]|nr:ABC transporter ATP-binding protein [Candidatus Acidoferrales bacterium]
MSNVIIKAENVSKLYHLGQKAVKGDGVRHILEYVFRNPAKWLRQRRAAGRAKPEEFWALKDVSFSVNQGDVVGIIGRNGAGKSTLLKVLSRITEPTTGRIEIDGRIASLLEVGTGFHGDLSGRENIFLNGAILGMTKVEIKRKFDEIVAFSEIEQFLDTPVKRYSSGMFVRLAFAVAAHLEPEILIVDEVLAVGDQAFQKKCLGKMDEVARGGRTILFVSHNMAVMRQLCNKGILLNHGQVMKSGTIGEVVDTYLAAGVEHEGHWQRQTPVPNKGHIYLEAASVFNSNGVMSGHLACTEDFTIEVKTQANAAFGKAQIALSIINKEGVIVMTTCNSDTARKYLPITAGKHTYRVKVPGNFLAPDTYYLKIVAHEPYVELHDITESTVSFRIEDVGSLRSVFNDARVGMVEPVLEWTDTHEGSGEAK